MASYYICSSRLALLLSLPSIQSTKNIDLTFHPTSGEEIRGKLKRKKASSPSWLFMNMYMKAFN